MKMTRSVIEKGRTYKGGWTKEQLALLSVNWPPAKNWIDLVDGWDYPQEKVDRFLALGKATYPKPKTLTAEQRKKKQAQLAKEAQERRPLKVRLGAKEPATMPNDSWTKATRERLLSKRNAAEKRIDELLGQLPVKYEREHPVVIKGQQFFIDFLIISTTASGRPKRLSIAMEVDGEYHFTKQQREKDRVRDIYLRKCLDIYSVLRISAKVASSISAEDLLYEILCMDKGSTRQMY